MTVLKNAKVALSCEIWSYSSNLNDNAALTSLGTLDLLIISRSNVAAKALITARSCAFALLVLLHCFLFCFVCI